MLLRTASRPPRGAPGDALTATSGLLAFAFATAALAAVLLHRYPGRLPHAAPNERSLHGRSIPRAGGLAILAGMLPVLALAPPAVPGPFWVWIAAGIAIATVSFADDVRSMAAGFRLAVHAAAALAVATAIFGGSPGAILLAALAIVWGANLFNFMDGSDGIAAAMAIVGFSAYAIAAARAGAPWLAYAAVAVATMPFFVANRPPAAMFMGDVGAVTLGFFAAAFGIAGVVSDTWPAWFPALVFLPFVADATITLAVRALRRERVWQAHRSHFYQRLNTLGAGHRGTLAIYGAAMLACAALALACLLLRAPRGGAIGLWAALAVHLTAFLAIDYHWRKNRQTRE